MAQIVIAGEIYIDPDRREACLAAGLGFQEATRRDEPGCLAYELCDVIVIGVRVIKLMRENHLWLQTAKGSNHRSSRRIVNKHVSVS